MVSSHFMPTDQIVSLLIQERDKLNEAIEVLQGTKRRGRSAKNPIGLVSSEVSSNGNRGRKFTAAQRRAQAKRMKAYWAAKKKATK